MMGRSKSLVGALAVVLTAMSPVIVNASVIYTVVIPSSRFGSSQGLEFLLGGLSSARKFCAQIDKAYVVDCLAERLGVIADQVPEGSDYTAFNEVLSDTSRKLETLARSNRDMAKPRGRAKTGGETPISTTRPLTPVDAQRTAEINRQARAILESAETVLLRSGGQSRESQSQYRQLAQAVGSTTVLLRSA